MTDEQVITWWVLAFIAAWGISKIISLALDAWVERARVNFKREQLRDRIFRDACDTVHHLRNENDKLTAMVMAMQKEKR